MRFSPRHLAWPALLIAVAMMPASTELSAQSGPEVFAAVGSTPTAASKSEAKTSKKLVKKGKGGKKSERKSE